MDGQRDDTKIQKIIDTAIECNNKFQEQWAGSPTLRQMFSGTLINIIDSVSY